MTTITYLEAIRQALFEEMEADPRVFVLGEDVGAYGGAFKVTAGLQEKFGEERVIDTPISESAIVGAAIGAALSGLRPVAEMQFIDFIACCFNMISNYAAKAHYCWGAAIPIVIRGPYGGGVHAGPFHSQCVESFFLNTPGIKVVTPATAADAKGLLKAAIRDPNPVLYLEHKYLYRRIKEEVSSDVFVPLGKAIIRREGKHLSLVTYSAMVHLAMEAAEELSRDGVEVEILDLRTLSPLDEEAVLQTARKTSKVILLHEAPRFGGFGGELAAIIAEKAFEYLDGPIMRVAAMDTPIPFGSPLEETYLPDVKKIVKAARKLMDY
ncbi:alpha-ketoacid dehydrogenase subunit beta [bacterium]|nr:alpha-ketoacid dehydrogenase subunit beta [bacterium]MCI0602142.1 alpha-ketoacid dehydrogenase subunit beta [bacterium]